MLSLALLTYDILTRRVVTQNLYNSTVYANTTPIARARSLLKGSCEETELLRQELDKIAAE